MPDDPRDVPGLEVAARAAANAFYDVSCETFGPQEADRQTWIDGSWKVWPKYLRPALAAYLRARAAQAEKSLAPGRYAVWLRQMADEVEVREERADA